MGIRGRVAHNQGPTLPGTIAPLISSHLGPQITWRLSGALKAPNVVIEPNLQS